VDGFVGGVVVPDRCVFCVGPAAVHPVVREFLLAAVAIAENERTKPFDIVQSSATKPIAAAMRIFLVIITAGIVLFVQIVVLHTDGP